MIVLASDYSPVAVVISSICRGFIFVCVDVSCIAWLVCCVEDCLDHVIGVAIMAVV